MRVWLTLLLLCCCVWSSAQTYHIGDVYTAPDGSKGIVYYIHPDGSGGWIVALNDVSSGCVWGDNTDVPGLVNQITSFQNLLIDTAGYANTQAIRNHQSNSTSYAAGLVDYTHGWVLPSSAQLSLLYGQLPFIATSIINAGGTALAYDWYWSSEERDFSNAYGIDFGTSNFSGHFNVMSKSSSCRVRAVRGFTTARMVYDTSLTYLWNMGSTQPYVNVIPTQTTTYTVTGTTNFGCSATAEQTILVGTGSAQTVYDTVCQGEAYEANGFSITTLETQTVGTITRSRTVEVNGCNFTLTIQLIINPRKIQELYQSACERYEWNGVTYYESGDYTQTFLASNGCDSVVTLHLTVDPVRYDTLRIMRSWLPYSFVEADTVFTSDVPDSFDFIWWSPAAESCDTMVLQTVLVYQDLSVSATGTINTDCIGRNCFYNGPTIMINEVMLKPDRHDGSIVGVDNSKKGEWIELYNPNYCDPVDISCFFLGNNAKDGGVNYGGGFSFPQGTIVPPRGFCVVRGANAPAVSSELLVENGGNVVEVVVEDRYCTGGGSRLWFPNAGGWFAFYDADGVPLDAIRWGRNSGASCNSCYPCLPSVDDCAYPGVLASYTEIPSARKNHISNVDLEFHSGSFRRIPDGGVWQSVPSTPTYGTCNADCVEQTDRACNAIAHVSIDGGVPPYTFQWNDVFEQTTDTAFYLCEGIYTVIVTDAWGNVDTAEVSIYDFVPEVSHENASFCYTDSSAVLQGLPAGGTYGGANFESNVLFFEENVTEYQLTYTVVDSNGCSATSHFQVHVTDNTYDIDSVVCSNDLPFQWNQLTIAEAGEYTVRLASAAACDSVVTLNLSVNQSYDVEDVLSICENDLPYTYGDTIFEIGTTSMSVHRIHNFTTAGCDSVTILTVQLLSLSYHMLDTNVLENNLPLRLNDSTYYDPNTYRQTLTNANGCDSVLTVNMTVLWNVTVPADSTVCESALPLEWNGQSFDLEDFQSATQTIIHSALLTASTGVDSTVVMTVHVNPTTYGTLDTTVLENDLPLWLNGLSYMTDSTFIQRLEDANAYGCDSLLTVNMAVLYNVEVEVDSTVCESALPLEWNGQSFDLEDFQSATQTIIHSALLTASTGVDSTVVMTVHVNPTTYGTLDTTVLENDLPLWLHGLSYMTDSTFQQTLIGINVNGCDSVLTVNMTVLWNVTVPADSTVCESALPLEWNGQSFDLEDFQSATQTIVQSALLTASTGVDSTVVMTVHVNPTTYGTLDTTVLENDLPLWLNGLSYMTDSTFQQTLIGINSNGCDSVLTVNMIVLYNDTVYVDTTICDDDFPFTWNQCVFNTVGTQNALFTAANGVDSVVVMTVNYNLTTYGSLDTSVLQNDLPLWLNGMSYSIPGIYTQDYLVNATGCDSVLTVNLTVIPNVLAFADSVICDREIPLQWNGYTFTQTSVIVVTLTASTGADSTLVMNVQVIKRTYGSVDTTVVENDLPYTINGESYTASSTYIQQLENHVGCDSILIVYLHVLYNVTVPADSTVCETDLPLIWNGQSFDLEDIQAATQTISHSAMLTASTGVDSTVVMTVHVNPTTYRSLDTIVLENNLPLWLHGLSYMTDSIFIQRLEDANAYGCDSLLTVNMAVLYNVEVEVDSTVCENDLPLVWNGQSFEIEDVQSVTQIIVHSSVLTASTGVDSTVVMIMHVNPTTYGTLDTIVFENDLPLWLNGLSYMTDSTFIQTLTGANTNSCDSVLLVNMSVLYNVEVEVDSTVCETDLPMSWNGQSFDLEDIQAATQTISHSAMLTASTGVDSTVVMTVHVNSTTYGTLDTTVLENNLPLWLHGLSYMTDSTFIQRLEDANAYGCDSLLTVNMIVLYNVGVEVDSTVCETDLPLLWNGQSFDVEDIQVATQTIIHSAVLTAITGVDSTVVMTVYVNSTTHGTLDTIVLENDLPLWLNGHSYMTDSTFIQTLTGASAHGCDSVLSVTMTVLHNVTFAVDSVVCDGELPLSWNGVTFVADSVHQDTHTYTQTAVLTASTGVDSAVVMTLYVHYATTGIDEQTACDSYTWIDGITYTASTDTATYILSNRVGCDSVVTLHLTINHSVESQDTLVLVENQLPYYFAVADTTILPGAPTEFQFSYMQTTSQGCDSTIVQTVLVHYNTSETEDTMVCVSSLPYTWHGHVFTGAGAYTDTLLNTNGSSRFVTWQMTVSNPVATMQNITHIMCYGASTGGVGVYVSGGISPYNCHWENSTGTMVSATAQLNNQQAGKYYLMVTDAMGCSLTDSVVLNHLNDTMIAGEIANNQAVCRGLNLVPFTGTVATGGASSHYQWQISTNGTDWNPAPAPNNTQNYTYQNIVTTGFYLRRAWISAACGTVYSNTLSIIVLPLFADTIRSTVCQGYPYYEYGFDITAEETSTHALISRTLYAQSEYGCDSTVTLLLTVIPTVHTTITDESCQNAPYQANGFDIAGEQLATIGEYTFGRVYHTNECDSIVTLLLTVNPVHNMNLEDEVCEGDDYANYGFMVPAVQTLGVSDLNLTQNLMGQNNCDSVINLHLIVVDTSIAIVSSTLDFCDEYAAELSVETNMMNYLWSTGETSQTITVNQPGTYTVTATQGNCSVSVRYQIETCELNVYLPNAITPGLGDGINDYFCLHEKYLSMIVDFEVLIYSRWGELVYYSNDKNFKWNGEYRGRINRNIIYTYLINFTDSRGIPHQLTGSITVM